MSIDNSAAIIDLRQAWQTGKLTLVVGAGASVQSKLPTWNQLMQELIVQYVARQYNEPPYGFVADDIRLHLSNELGAQSPIVAAHYLKSRMTAVEFLDLAHRALYVGHSEAPTPGPIARAVGRLGTKLNCVITFNFDDLLERALSAEGCPNTSVWNASDLSKIRGLPVYHPHGFMPYKRDPSAVYWVVLSEDDYHTQYNSPFGWSNIAVVRALLETTCLFVGTSLTDPNLRRLLDSVHRDVPTKQHYFLWGRPQETQMKGIEGLVHHVFEQLFKDSHSRLGVAPVWFHHQQWDEIPEILDSIRQLG